MTWRVVGLHREETSRDRIVTEFPQENVVTAEDLFKAYEAAVIASGGTLPPCGMISAIDVVWWMTGLSPTKYDVEPMPNVAAWKIVRR